MDNRWVEVPKLTLWAINRLNKLCEYFAENNGNPNGNPSTLQVKDQEGVTKK
jgi:hypothetical protein